MQHLDDDDLTLIYYGEQAEAGHLTACAACRERYSALQRLLNSVDIPVPARSADYESEIWSRLQPKLGARRSRPVWWSWRALASTAAVACIIALAFLSGRFFARNTQPEPAAVAGDAVRERVLIVAVSDHLERSQMVLAELLNKDGGNTGLDLSSEREMAESLVGANRLYRRTALNIGDSATASLLEDLERVLLEIAHSPESEQGPQLQHLADRVRQQGLMFRIRVTESSLKNKLAVPEESGEL